MTQLAVHGRTFDVDAVMVDLDGTLVDTLGDFHEALSRMLDELGLPTIAPEPLACMVGKGSEHLLISVLNYVHERAGKAITTAQLEALYARAWPSYQRHYQAINGQFATLYRGVRDGLQALTSAGLLLACVTNKPTAFAEALLLTTDLRAFFGPVAGGDAFEKKKPHPLPLLRTCEALGSLPARTLMVGDSANDAQAARAAGCPVLLMTYGYNHGLPARSVDADAWADSIAELRVVP